MKKNRTDLLFYYTEKLGLIPFQDLMTMFQQGIGFEEYLSKQNLPVASFQKLKFILFKHFLMMEAENDGFLTKAQVIHLVNQKIWELKKQNPPFSILSLDVDLIPADYFEVTIQKLDTEKTFLLRELQSLVSSSFLRLPEQHSEVLKKLTTMTNFVIHKEIIKDNEETLVRYNIKCSCGSTMVLEIEVGARAKLYCTHCKKLVLDLRKRQSSGGKTLNEVAPEVVEQMNWEQKNKQFAGYELLKKLGEGASGKVYMAQKKDSEEVVALKILQKTDKSQYIDYFKREIKILQEVKHPHIVALKDWGEYEGRPYLAMEYIDGYTILDLIKNGISVNQTLKIMNHILYALSHAHKQNLVHRDIKPANIFVSKNGQVKLIDMGIAKILEDSLGLTQSGQLMGTPYYLAPEQIKNFKHVTQQADVYSVGATLFHCLCGVPPFFEYDTSTMRILMNKAKDNYVRLHERNPNLPKVICKIVEKAMAYNLEIRYKTANDMRQDLIKFHQMSSTGGE